ncbi:MAG: hypothetical protein COB66_04560 [Coxiella sp. (in: Bacteria)]|nr:MAG: hypothetical protein COB66_04560 [Coxiella sp. (in: g-proteobacteria)]
MITLYYCQTSYASHKVRIYLAEKNIPFKAIHIDLLKQEHLSSDYRNINANGTVPTMIDDDGHTFSNSTDIMFALEIEYLEPELLPAETSQRELIHQICAAHELLHDPSIRTLSYHKLFMNAQKRQGIDIERVIALARQHPNRARGKFLERAITGKLTPTEIAQSQQAILDALTQMEHYLTSSDERVIVGSHYSIADCVCTASAYRIEKLGMLADIIALPRVNRWYMDMKRRDSFKRSLATLDFERL